jgi:hypothetical protein
VGSRVIAPYLDSSAIIYLIEGSAAVRDRVAAEIASADQQGDPSRPTGECRAAARRHRATLVRPWSNFVPL